MNGLLNNALSVRTLNNLMKGLDNRICEIYNQGYREGYKDGTEVALDKIKEQIISEVFGNDQLKG